MAPFNREYATSYQSAIVNTDRPNHVPFLRYLTLMSLKNVLTMKSNLEITHPANLCTVAEIYRPSVNFQLLTVWVVCLTFAYTQSTPDRKKFDWGCTLRSFSHSGSGSLKLVLPIEEARMQITITSTTMTHTVPIFYRFRDITIYWSKICILPLLLTALSFEATMHKGVTPGIYGTKAGINKLEVHGLSNGEHRMRIRSLIWRTTTVCWTDRQTVRRT